jgi:hypothetical protein
MVKDPIRLEVLKAQIISKQCYITYFDARIKSGAYKTRIVHKTMDSAIIDGKHTFTGPLMTEAELLNDELQTMLRHIHQMNELIESIHDC